MRGARVQFSHRAMGTTFGIQMETRDPKYAARAAQEVWDLVDRLEEDLSRFVHISDISRIHALEAGGQTGVSPETAACLALAKRLHRETGGAFDVSLGEAMDPAQGALPDGPRGPVRSGMEGWDLDPGSHRVRVAQAGIRLDLGGLGKGHALDRAADLLREWDLNTALLHAGASTALALGRPEGRRGWPVALRDPGDGERVLATLDLENQAWSGSAMGRLGRHVLDPRTGEPARGCEAAWAGAPSAGEADALSTAFLVMGAAGVQKYCDAHPGITGVVWKEGRLHRYGDWGKDA